MTFIKMFHTSCTVFSNPNHRLYRLVNWDRIEAGEYALVDPVDSGNILYLTEPDYIILVRQSLNSGRRPLVLARPSDSRPTSQPSPSPDGSQNSPPEWYLGRRISKGPITRRYKTLFHWVPKVVRRFGLKENVENLAVVTKGNLRPLFMLWGLHLYVKVVGLGSTSRFRSEMSSFIKYLIGILETQGVGALVVRLKVMYFVLQTFVSGTKLTSSQAVGLRVRLTAGLPSSFPKSVRMAIRSNNVSVIRLWSSLLYIYKSLESSHKIPSFSAIGNIFRTDYNFTFVKTRFDVFLQMEAKPWLSGLGASELLCSNLAPVEPFLATTAGPNHSTSIASYPIDTLYWVSRGWKLSPLVSYMDAVGATSFRTRIESYAVEMLKFVLDDDWKEAWKLSSDFGDSVNLDPEKLAHYFPTHSKLEGPKGRQVKVIRPSGGKLSLIKEAAGKVRVIAIPDALTQSVLKPMHKVLFDILRMLPSDATFDQQGSLRTFAESGHKDVYSYDLKAATDTIPLVLYTSMLSSLFGTEISEAWTSLLRDRTWSLPYWQITVDGKETVFPLSFTDKLGNRSQSVRYARGQPMGVLSSWGALALLHHFVVQYSAFLVGKYPYYDYRVLGDDIVIAGKDVARSYLNTCSYLGIKVGLAKSFSSEKGFINFAGQSYLGPLNLSPISFKQEMAANDGFGRLSLVTQAVARGWISLDSGNFMSACLRYMLPPLYVNQIEVSRKEGKVHDAAVSSSNLIFRSLLEGGLPLLKPLGGPTLSVVSSGMLFPGLQLLCSSLDVLAERSPERDWAARENLFRLILRQIDKLEQALELRLEECEKVSPQYGFVRFLWPQEISVRNKGKVDLSFTLPLLERFSDEASEALDNIVVGLNNIRFICSGVRLELPLIVEEGDLDDLFIGYQRLLSLESEITGKSLSNVGIFLEDPEKSGDNTLLHELLLQAADLSELDRLGVEDHVFPESLGLNLVRMSHSIRLASLAQQTHQGSQSER